MSNTEITFTSEEEIPQQLMLLGVVIGTSFGWEETDPNEMMWCDVQLDANGQSVLGHLGAFEYLYVKWETGQFQLGIIGESTKYHEGVINFLAVSTLR